MQPRVLCVLGRIPLNAAREVIAGLPDPEAVSYHPTIMIASTRLTHYADGGRDQISVRVLPNGTNVNHTLVKDGWCWWYRKYALGDVVLEGLEKDAPEAKKGLWADPQPVPPWQWRKRK
jgi:endonuclease YncB( thermonuclease family)